MKTDTRLVFVYNADSGLFNLLSDHAHKLLSPSTYRCNLCLLTFDGFAMKNEWKEFIASLRAETVFLHADEWKTRHPEMADVPLPAAFLESGTAADRLVSAEEIRGAYDLSALISLMKEKLAGQ